VSYITVVPDVIASAATDLTSIGSTVGAADAAAAASTTQVLAAGADEVSTAIAALFGAQARGYQAVSAQAAAFHQQFVQAMRAGGNAYAAAEAANASPLQTLQQDVMGAINAPTEALFARPLIGNGTNATTPGGNGGAGGILWGNGGNGAAGAREGAPVRPWPSLFARLASRRATPTPLPSHPNPNATRRGNSVKGGLTIFLWAIRLQSRTGSAVLSRSYSKHTMWSQIHASDPSGSRRSGSRARVASSCTFLDRPGAVATRRSCSSMAAASSGL